MTVRKDNKSQNALCILAFDDRSSVVSHFLSLAFSQFVFVTVDPTSSPFASSLVSYNLIVCSTGDRSLIDVKPVCSLCVPLFVLLSLDIWHQTPLHYYFSTAAARRGNSSPRAGEIDGTRTLTAHHHQCEHTNYLYFIWHRITTTNHQNKLPVWPRIIIFQGCFLRLFLQLCMHSPNNGQNLV